MPAGVEAILASRNEIDAELRKHKSPLTVMFTDLAGSTSFFDRYGDTVGVAWLEEHNSIVIPAVQSHSGIVVKTIGDSVMAYFADASQAVAAACDIESKLHQANAGREATLQMSVRVALHHGLGYLRGGDVFGDVVNVAARIAKACLPFQILVSESVYLSAHESAGITFRPMGTVQFAGKSSSENTYEVLWTDETTYAALRAQYPAKSGAAGTATAETGAQADGRYMVLNEIGRGAMGVVYRAYDRVIGRVVAMKTIPMDADPETRANSLERLKQEAKTAGLLDHPNIVMVHDVGEEAGLFFFTMQFLEGHTLEQLRTSKEVMPLDRCFEIADQLCAAVSFAHQAGIIHRDLKPSNVMLTQHGSVKVLDFGIAKLGDSGLTQAGVVLGTPSYLAPEQAVGRRIDLRADIFSLGAVLYELFTNDRAFAGDSTTAIVYKVLNESPIPPHVIDPSLPKGLDDIIARALAKDPSQRYQNCDELRDALQACRAQLPPKPGVGTSSGRMTAQFSAVAAPAPAPSAPGSATASLNALAATAEIPVAKAGGKNAILLGVAAGVVVVLLGVGGVVLWTKQQQPSEPATSAAQAQPATAEAVPANEKEALARADSAQSAGKPEAAIPALEAFLFRHPESVAVRMRYAMLLAVQKKFNESLNQYQEVLKADPKNVGAQVGVAKVTSWNGDLPGALKLYDAVLAKSPKNYDARVGKAFTLMWLRRDDEARKLFQAAAHDQPGDQEVAAALVKLSQPRSEQ